MSEPTSKTADRARAEAHRWPVDRKFQARTGERLMVCRNPLLADERARKRRELIAATEADLLMVQRQVERERLLDPAKIGLRVGEKLHRFKLAKHFEITIAAGHLSWRINAATVQHEAALDGTSVDEAEEVLVRPTAFIEDAAGYEKLLAACRSSPNGHHADSRTLAGGGLRVVFWVFQDIEIGVGATTPTVC